MSLKDSLRIMVVDDMSVSRALITQSLDEMAIRNYQTEADGHAALSKLVAAPVHLVISDMNMPRMSGLELLAARGLVGSDLAHLPLDRLEVARVSGVDALDELLVLH